MAKSQRDVAKEAYWRKLLKQFSSPVNPPNTKL